MLNRRLLIIIVVLTSGIFSQKNFTSDPIIIPKPIPYDQPDFSEWRRNSEQNRVYPIGWSKDFSFAWIQREDSGGSDFDFYKLNILDFYNDTLITESYRVGLSDSNHYAIECTLECFYEMKRDEIFSKLNKYYIVPREYDFYPFPILAGKYLNDAYHIELWTEKTVYSKKNVYNIEIKLVRECGSKEIIYKKQYEERDKNRLPIAVQVLGYIAHHRSPYIAISIVEIRSNPFEGAPYIMDYEFVITGIKELF